jgi:hypothetical protein
MSFASGLVIGGLGSFATGFLTKAGGDAWSAIRHRIFPPEPAPIVVPNNFDAKQYEQGEFAWVPEVDRFQKEAEGYTYFQHPHHLAKCFRQLPQRKEFLMRRPN